MSDLVCAGCGAEDSIYREAEVIVDGWRDVTVTLDPDGRISYDEGPLEKGNVIDDMGGDFACSECRHTARTIQDMVKEPEGPLAEDVCCCGHTKREHPAQKSFDKTRYTRGRCACAEVGCGCWEFETDPALATVVREAAAG